MYLPPEAHDLIRLLCHLIAREWTGPPPFKHPSDFHFLTTSELKRIQTLSSQPYSTTSAAAALLSLVPPAAASTAAEAAVAAEEEPADADE